MFPPFAQKGATARTDFKNRAKFFAPTNDLTILKFCLCDWAVAAEQKYDGGGGGGWRERL